MRWMVLVLSLMLTAAGGGAHAQAAPGCAYRGGAAHVPLPGRPFGLAASADGCWLFVAVSGRPDAGGVAVLKNEGGGFRLLRTVPMRGVPAGVALSHDGRTLAVTANSVTSLVDVAALQGGTGEPLIAAIDHGPGAGAIYAVFSRDDRLLVVSEERRADLAVIDVARRAVTGHVPQGQAPVGLALSPDGSRLYAVSEIAPRTLNLAVRCPPQTGAKGPDQSEGLLTVVDVGRAAVTPDRAVEALAAAGCGPVRVAVAPGGEAVYVTARGDNRLLRFDLRALKPVTREDPPGQPVGVAPIGVAVSADGQTQWVANSDRFGQAAGTVSRIGGGAQTQIPSGRFPREVNLLPDGRTVVVSVFGDGALQFLP